MSYRGNKAISVADSLLKPKQVATVQRGVATDYYGSRIWKVKVRRAKLEKSYELAKT